VGPSSPSPHGFPPRSHYHLHATTRCPAPPVPPSPFSTPGGLPTPSQGPLTAHLLYTTSLLSALTTTCHLTFLSTAPHLPHLTLQFSLLTPHHTSLVGPCTLGSCHLGFPVPTPHRDFHHTVLHSLHHLTLPHCLSLTTAPTTLHFLTCTCSYGWATAHGAESPLGDFRTLGSLTSTTHSLTHTHHSFHSLTSCLTAPCTLTLPLLSLPPHVCHLSATYHSPCTHLSPHPPTPLPSSCTGLSSLTSFPSACPDSPLPLWVLPPHPG